MHGEPKSALKQAIQNSLPILREWVDQFLEPYLVWKKRCNGGWDGEYQQKPDLARLFGTVNDRLVEASTDFAKLFFEKYSEYEGMVGFPGFGKIRLGNDKSQILRDAILYLWNRHGTFDCDEASVDSVVQEFEEFVDRPTVRFRFQAQLRNYRMSRSTITFPEGLTIRRLSEDEVSAFQGGPLMTDFLRPRNLGIDEFVIEGEHEEEKVFGDFSTDTVLTLDSVKSRLDTAVLCLRNFQEGHVGYEYLEFKPLSFCPLLITSPRFHDLYVPIGNYNISDEDVCALCEYAEHIFGMSEPAMEMACNRLADAEPRLRPRDRIVDAVIGMETLLLA